MPGAQQVQAGHLHTPHQTHISVLISGLLEVPPAHWIHCWSLHKGTKPLRSLHVGPMKQQKPHNRRTPGENQQLAELLNRMSLHQTVCLPRESCGLQATGASVTLCTEHQSPSLVPPPPHPTSPPCSLSYLLSHSLWHTQCHYMTDSLSQPYQLFQVLGHMLALLAGLLCSSGGDKMKLSSAYPSDPQHKIALDFHVWTALPLK